MIFLVSAKHAHIGVFLYTCCCFFLSFQVGASWVWVQLCDGEKLEGLSASAGWRQGMGWCGPIRKNLLVRREKHREPEGLECLSAGQCTQAALPSSDVFRLELEGEGCTKASSWDLFCRLSRLGVLTGLFLYKKLSGTI